MVAATVYRMPHAIWLGRQALAVHRLDKPVIAGVAAGAGMSLAVGNRAVNDRRESLAGFLEKRKPVYTGI